MNKKEKKKVSKIVQKMVNLTLNNIFDGSGITNRGLRGFLKKKIFKGA
jgi:hypothetical protein